MNRFKLPVALCLAVALLAAGMGLGRWALLSQGAVIRGGGLSASVGQLAYAPPSAGQADTAASAVDWRIGINGADVDQLAELPGIGPQLAGRIVAYREQNGDFESLEEIMAVKGIGPAVYAKLEAYISLD